MGACTRKLHTLTMPLMPSVAVAKHGPDAVEDLLPPPRLHSTKHVAVAVPVLPRNAALPQRQHHAAGIGLPYVHHHLRAKNGDEASFLSQAQQAHPSRCTALPP